MLKIKHAAVCMLALAMLSAGCTNYSGNTYSGSQVRSAQTVQYGTVVSVQPVTLEEDRPAPWDSGRRRRRRRARQYGWWWTREDAGDYRWRSPRRGWRLCRREGADQAEWALKLRLNWKTGSNCPLFRPPISSFLRGNASVCCAAVTARRV